MTKDEGNHIPLEQRESFLIHKANAKLALVCSSAFNELGVNLYSSRILVALLEYERLRVGQIAAIMVLPQSTISHQIKRLEKQGYSLRERAQDDNRTVEVSLTPKGRKVAIQCERLSIGLTHQMHDIFSPKEARQFRDLLRKYFDGMPDQIKNQGSGNETS